MVNSSPYVINEAEPPKWKPREDLAAAAFIGMAMWVLFDVQVCIIRVFKRRRGLYYWTLQLGVLGALCDAVGVILKYLVPGTSRIWVLYTLLLLGGWGVYAPMQLLILYSRLHLVNDRRWVQKLVLIVTLSTYLTFVLPTWVVIWHSYNPDHAISSLWSPRNAIIERYTQIGFTLVECIVSGIYIWSLLGLLKEKSTIRQRRVMNDLIYVNIIICVFDIIVVIFIYLNQLGISHPLQTFSYAIKFKLEFVVLNQLMAVAARGITRKSWEERRYTHGQGGNEFSAQCRKWAGQPTNPEPDAKGPKDEPPEYIASQNETDITMPDTVHSRTTDGTSILSLPSPHIDPSNMDSFTFGAEPKLELQTFFDDTDEANTEKATTVRERPSQATGMSGDTLQPPEGEARAESPHLLPRHRHRSRLTQSIADRARQSGHGRRSSKPDYGRHQFGEPVNATLRKGSVDEDDEEEIGVHMWENHGKLILDAPWFEKKKSQEKAEV